ncbi:hypothetical protein B0T11DRAFT_225317 [Plectosphaerella cucumerina]|uniref:Uncharacterized protein n=1 Tax=Plectosphaerella cucumerina TaxID=40658 RepID=A0A8K0THT1_9PEZI|nr:hypothetical protein B0T11DRAFT_225317 [Plectosphaerella cucumerina]
MDAWGTTEKFQERLSRAFKVVNASGKVAGDDFGPSGLQGISLKRQLSDETVSQPKRQRLPDGEVDDRPSRKRGSPDDDFDDRSSKRQRQRPQSDLDIRMMLYPVFQECKTIMELNELLSCFGTDEMTVAFVLSDVPEKLRLRALSYLQRRRADACERVIQNMRYMQHHAERFNPQSLFPMVFFSGIYPIEKCSVCGESLKEFEDFIFKGCGRCPIHPRCLTNGLMTGSRPMFGMCLCVG